MTDFYDAQRAMRSMRKAALQRGVIAVLDVGSTKIGCLILRFDGVDRNIDAETVGPMAGQSGFRVIGSATTRSRGIEFGEVVSMPEAERAIRTALQSAQKLAGVRVDHVIASFSGGAEVIWIGGTNHGRGSICNRTTHCRSFIGLRCARLWRRARGVACATCEFRIGSSFRTVRSARTNRQRAFDRYAYVNGQ